MPLYSGSTPDHTYHKFWVTPTNLIGDNASSCTDNSSQTPPARRFGYFNNRVFPMKNSLKKIKGITMQEELNTKHYNFVFTNLGGNQQACSRILGLWRVLTTFLNDEICHLYMFQICGEKTHAAELIKAGI
uniref:Uncharacterized protein n=1 Tax=Magallana gigas TaxID=29159 RepID=K1QYF8_MAGGI